MKKETVAELIARLPNDPQYQAKPNIPIPLGKSVIIKKVKQEAILSLGGIILGDSVAENTQAPHIGIIYGTGPSCSEHLRVGVRCLFNYYADLTVRVDGEEYVLMEESSVYYILKPNNWVDEGVKSAKRVRKEKAIKDFDAGTMRIHQREMNEKDKAKDKTKGKIRKIK